MLTKLAIRNFKLFDDVEIELGNPVVFIGPNNSGKTTALQALALWNVGLRRWSDLVNGARNSRRSSVAINRYSIYSIPTTTLDALWPDFSLKRNPKIELIVSGESVNENWECGFEFTLANEESLDCRPLRRPGGSILAVPEQAYAVRAAFLPSISGIDPNEPRFEVGTINTRLSEGRAADVIRNVCYRLASEDPARWTLVRERIAQLFGIALDPPMYISDRGEIRMTYLNLTKPRPNKPHLDITSAGQGLLQVLLLVAYLEANRGAVLLLDEPDAHLEILRQRDIYNLLSHTAQEYGSQIIAASHSEVILDEAGERDVVISFVGSKPHRTDRRSRAQLRKALDSIRPTDYYSAEQRGWVLYLEGSTDLAILRSFAHKLNKSAALDALAEPFAYYLNTNVPSKAREHFYGLHHAKSDMVGYALFDRVEPATVQNNPTLRAHSWQRCEIENYLCQPQTLLAWAYDRGGGDGDVASATLWQEIMAQTIGNFENALRIVGRGSPWSPEIKASDEVLIPLFKEFYQNLAQRDVQAYNEMNKSNFHRLAEFVPVDNLDPEVGQVLDEIVAVVEKAKPTQ